MNSSDRPTTPTIDRTCRSGGSGHAGRDQPAGALVVGGHDDPAVVEHRGAPCTSSTQVSSLSSNSTEVVIEGSSPASGQDLQPALVPALHRQHDALGLRPLHVDQVGKADRSHGTSRRPPSSASTHSVTSALAVPVAGCVLQGGWSGRAGSLIHQRATGDVSTRVAARAEPSGDHQ